MKKPVWKGTLSFGLVNIQVELFSAIESAASIGFKMLHNEKCQNPVNYNRVCSHCKKAVEWGKIVKGIKLASGDYLTMTPENIKKLRPKKSENIVIKEFINSSELEPLSYDKHYYIAPAKATERAFYLFSEALNKIKKVAIGQFIMRDKEYLIALQAYKGGLLLSTLNYASEIRTPKELEAIEKNKPELDEKEIELAIELINKLYNKKFKADVYKDSFNKYLKKQIALAEQGKELQEDVTVDDIQNKAKSLIESLKESLKEEKKVKK